MTTPKYRYIAVDTTEPSGYSVGTNDPEVAKKLANWIWTVIDCLHGEFFTADGENTLPIREATPEDYE
jgi:hypothetical protein